MLSKKSVVIFATLLAYCHANAVASTDETNVNGNEDQEEACPVVCPALYAPTCGFDGADYQEFVNPCMLQVTNCARRKERALKKRKYLLLFFSLSFVVSTKILFRYIFLFNSLRKARHRLVQNKANR